MSYIFNQSQSTAEIIVFGNSLDKNIQNRWIKMGVAPLTYFYIGRWENSTERFWKIKFDRVEYDPDKKVATIYYNFNYFGDIQLKTVVLNLTGAPPEVLALFEHYQIYRKMPSTATATTLHAELRF